MKICAANQAEIELAGACPWLDSYLRLVHCSEAAEQVLHCNAEALLLANQRLYTPRRQQILLNALRPVAKEGHASWSLPRSARLPLTLKAEFHAPLPGLCLLLCLYAPHLRAPVSAVPEDRPAPNLADDGLADAPDFGHGPRDARSRLGEQFDAEQSQIQQILNQADIRRQCERAPMILLGAAMYGAAAPDRQTCIKPRSQALPTSIASQARPPPVHPAG